MTTRVYLADFALANHLYSGATVSVYTVDPSTGIRTTTFAPLYADTFGAAQLANPQALDGDGKWLAPVYVDQAVVMAVDQVGLAAHETGVFNNETDAGWANIMDYFGVDKTDAALALRNAVASGNKVVYVPPGNYRLKSTVTTYGHAIGPSCVELRGLSGVTIYAYGATLTVDDTIATRVPVHVSFTSNSKRCQLLGATLVGSRAGLSQSDENCGVNLTSVSGCAVRDVTMHGVQTAFVGVYHFDCLAENVTATGVAQGFDFAHSENFEASNCYMKADPAFPVTGFNHHYDVATLADNDVTDETGSPRTLRGGISNRLNVLDCTFDGFGNTIAIEDMRNSRIRSKIKGAPNNSDPFGSAGVLLYLGSTAQGAGLVNSDCQIEHSEITNCGTSGGGGTGAGVLISPYVTNVSLQHNHIHDNWTYGVMVTDQTGVSGLTDYGTDYSTRTTGGPQIAAYHPSSQGIITAALGPSSAGWSFQARGDAVLFNKPTVSTVPAGVAANYENNTNLSWRDGVGAYQPIIGVSPINITFIRAAGAAAYVTLQNKSGDDLLKAATNVVEILAPSFRTDPGTTSDFGGSVLFEAAFDCAGRPRFSLADIGSYASDAAAGTAGLTAGMMYAISGTSPQQLAIKT